MTYSGGKARRGTASCVSAADLWGSLFTLLEAHEAQTDKRMLRTGSFALSTAAGERSLIIKRAQPLEAFQAALTTFCCAE